MRELRLKGKTYTEIKLKLGIQVPKSTLATWCKQIEMPQGYTTKIEELNKINRTKGRLVALATNKRKREELLRKINETNKPLARFIKEPSVAKIALAMLCLGEASKSKRSASFYLGNSDPKIIVLFINLLKACFDFDIHKVRCTVQCRADQDPNALEEYWMEVTGVPKELFYPSRVDPRTVGRPTKQKEHKGVLRVDYFDSLVRLQLESLANLVYNQLT